MKSQSAASLHCPMAGRQRGIALPVIMILMVVLALLSVSGMDDTALQERMAGNLRDRGIAFQAAEAALRDGETWLQNNSATAAGNDAMPLRADGTHTWDVTQWDGTQAGFAPSGTLTGLYSSDDIVSLAANPMYYVGPPQLLRSNPGEVPPRFREIFPVYARSVGGTDTAVVVLRTTFEPL